MIRKSRLIVSMGLVLALGVGSLAFADGISENTPQVIGKVSPKKLDKKKFKPVSLLAGVATTGPVPGENPESEFISFGKNIKFKTKAAPTCSAAIEFLTTEAAKQACPKKSFIGSGKASIELPGGITYDDLVVNAFNGPNRNELRLHTYSPSLEGATPTVLGQITNSSRGGKYKKALSVQDAPDVAGDTGKITSFNAKISKKSKVVRARCKSKKIPYERLVTYDDGTQETVTTTQKCKRKKGKKRK